MTEQLDTVVRFHDVKRLPELARAIFSLAGQTYRPLHVILAAQRFSTEEIAATRETLAPIIGGDGTLALSIVNFEDSQPQDARSILLNLGIKEAQGRYLAFLDYDDVLYPEAYELLVAQLKKSKAAIAFASVRIMWLQVFDRFFYTEQPVPGFSGSHLIDLFRSNFCPLHSYLIDRHQVPMDLLTFNPYLTIEEDYDVLLRVCARHPSDFSLIGTEIGHYYYKTDGSNTIPHDGAPLSPELTKHYDDVHTTIERRRKTTLISPAVKRQLGLRPSAQPTTIRELIDNWS